MAIERVDIQIRTPVAADQIAANIRNARSLGLEYLDRGSLKTLHLVASGPSAEAYFEAPRWGDALAINGALPLFRRHRLAPDFWLACDPQAMVTEFLTDPPLLTRYIVASKCDPAVFKALQGRSVQLFDIDDHPLSQTERAIPVASSATLVALSLMHRVFGYRRIETWGWDCCFEGEKHHATDQTFVMPEDRIHTLLVGSTAVKNEAGEIVDLEGGRPFKTTRSWCAEAQDAMHQLLMADYEVVIHGDGMVRAVIEHGRAEKARETLRQAQAAGG